MVGVLEIREADTKMGLGVQEIDQENANER